MCGQNKARYIIPPTVSVFSDIWRPVPHCFLTSGGGGGACPPDGDRVRKSGVLKCVNETRSGIFRVNELFCGCTSFHSPCFDVFLSQKRADLKTDASQQETFNPKNTAI